VRGHSRKDRARHVRLPVLVAGRDCTKILMMLATTKKSGDALAYTMFRASGRPREVGGENESFFTWISQKK